MSRNQIHISDAEMEALTATAALGHFAVEELVGAAAWAFGQQERTFQEHLIRGRWLYDPASADETRPRRQTLKEKFYALARRLFSLFG
jgi:hypothetical protein